MQRPEKFTPDRMAVTRKALEGVTSHVNQALRSLASARAMLSQNAPEPQLCDVESAMRMGLDVRLVVSLEGLTRDLGIVQSAQRHLDAMQQAVASPSQKLFEMPCLTESKQ